MTQAEKYLCNTLILADLIDSGIALMRENLKRRNPSLDQAGIDRMLACWLRRENDAVPGDVAGAVRIRKHYP
jgi:hypothetical protein